MGRRTLLLIASVLVAATGTALIWLYVQGADARARGEWQDLVPVLVAEQNIAVGANGAMVQRSVTQKRLPRALVPKDVIIADGIGTRLTTVPILAGQYVIKAQFTETSRVSPVPDGRFGLQVAMEDPNRVAGLLRPESRVAVYAVLRGKGSQQVKLLLNDVRVLAVGDQTVAGNGSGEAAKVGSQSGVSMALVTLDVATEQVQQIIYYQEVGTLYFALHGKGSKGDPRHDVSRASTATVANE